MRYREMDCVDLDAVSKLVRHWLRVDGAPAWLRVIEGGTTPRRDSVKRLHVFQGEQPAVQFTSPTGGLRAHGRYAALIPPGTIPGETREITVTSADLCGLMDQLNDLFSSAD
jgi:hypothetical protein